MAALGSPDRGFVANRRRAAGNQSSSGCANAFTHPAGYALAIHRPRRLGESLVTAPSSLHQDFVRW